jgi:hypothetical protein
MALIAHLAPTGCAIAPQIKALRYVPRFCTAFSASLHADLSLWSAKWHGDDFSFAAVSRAMRYT